MEKEKSVSEETLKSRWLYYCRRNKNLKKQGKTALSFGNSFCKQTPFPSRCPPP